VHCAATGRGYDVVVDKLMSGDVLGLEIATDDEAMSLALELAAQAQGRTTPNPMVGCVIVRDGRVIAAARHEHAGDPHAEPQALDAAQGRARGATLYVTLEPCAHEGRTPPCTPAIVTAGISRCVIAMRDPNPGVAGGGVEILRAAGIDVEVGVMEDSARRLNEAWITHVTTRRPFVTAKFAASLDGRIATANGLSRWITSEEARSLAHQLRSAHDGVLVGIGTVLVDDPALDARFPGARQPIKIILDTHLRTPLTARCLAGSTCLVATGPNVNDSGLDAEILRLDVNDDAVVSLPALLDELGRRDMISVLVEGGATVLGGFFDAGLVNKVVCMLAPRIIGGSTSLGAVGGRGVDSLVDTGLLRDVAVDRVGRDIVVTGYC
jgi:diaminohydroxyphosphoribosylaminopyrimidine deaminase / 5-amino-6-(5-phosphoribosylamino)uracil reductase